MVISNSFITGLYFNNDLIKADKVSKESVLKFFAFVDYR